MAAPKRATRDIDLQRAALGPAWLDHRDAARELDTDTKTLRETIGPLIRRESGSQRGRGPRAVGYVYARADVERCKAFMAALGCKALHAARLLHDMRRLAELGQVGDDELFAGFVTLLEREIDNQCRAMARRKRRFQ